MPMLILIGIYEETRLTESVKILHLYTQHSIHLLQVASAEVGEGGC